MRRLFLKPILSEAMDALLPEQYRCFGCGRERILGIDGLCDACRKQLVPCPTPKIPKPLDGLALGVRYCPPIQFAVLQLKMQRHTEYAPFLAQYFRYPNTWNADVLVPVPMHPIRQFKRRFNHCDLLAKLLSEQTGVPYAPDLLRRIRNGLPQKNLTGKARRKNVIGSFEADPACKGLRVVIVDDLYTTGATVSECAKALKKAGAAVVYACTVAGPRD